MLTIGAIYPRLLAAYGPQGWWPLMHHLGTNPTKAGSVAGYHPGRYEFPRHERERFEICLGAILTQNTAWPNVEKALRNLDEVNALSLDGLAALDDDALREAIRPSGYFNAKTRKLRAFARFYADLGDGCPERDALLAVWGIGPETADSIRLYAYGCPEMVVDTYTRRILVHLGLVGEGTAYIELKTVCSRAVPGDVVSCQEFHALMVEHAKRHYRRKPYGDPLLGQEG